MNHGVLGPTFLLLTSVAALAALAPAASAQATQPAQLAIVFRPDPLEPGLHDGLLQPETETARARAEIRLTVPPFTPCQGTVSVSVAVKSRPTYASAIVHPPTVNYAIHPLDTIGPEPRTFSQTVNVIVNTTRDAPAFQDGSYTLRATASLNNLTCRINTAPAEAILSIKNGYMPLLEVHQTGNHEMRSSGTSFVELVNLGNGPSRITVEIVQVDFNRLSQVVPPPQAHLAARWPDPSATWKAGTEIHYVLAKPGVTTYAARFLMEYDGHAPQNLATVEETVTFHVGLESDREAFDPEALPFPGLGTLLASLGAAAWLRRRNG